MRPLLFALIAIGFSLPLRAEFRNEVLVYSGSATELRPGARHRTSRAILVVQSLGDYGGLGMIALLVGGSNARPPFIAGVSSDWVGNPDGFRFPHWRSLTTAGLPIPSETRLNLTGNYTDDLALLLRPRKFTGRLTETKFRVSSGRLLEEGSLIIVPNVPPTNVDPSPQPPDFSDLSLVLTLDVKRTHLLRAINLKFDNAVDFLKARL
jgi:hypothetical protein